MPILVSIMIFCKGLCDRERAWARVFVCVCGRWRGWGKIYLYIFGVLRRPSNYKAVLRQLRQQGIVCIDRRSHSLGVHMIVRVIKWRLWMFVCVVGTCRVCAWRLSSGHILCFSINVTWQMNSSSFPRLSTSQWRVGVYVHCLPFLIFISHCLHRTSHCLILSP